MPTSTHKSTRSSTSGQKAPKDSYFEQPRVIQSWATDVDRAMQDMPSSSLKLSKMQEPSGESSSDIQFDTLMADYAELREKMKRIENKIAELYYDRQRNGNTVSSAFFQVKISRSQEGPGVKGESAGAKQQDSSPAFSDYDDYSHKSEAKRKAKTHRVKMPKTAEEQDRHINKVLMRESMNRNR
ncbi:hypothetical protein FLONG3_11326 [Fusarium longipes]|uniref:Uncharacterized protein n=1 Tax=Fusarium longipes TaxID=694270 RepID=A0A395RFT9_9HYPO|nr:hypothetical protein FLONG3_11326 [Fusarium longipes]